MGVCKTLPVVLWTDPSIYSISPSDDRIGVTLLPRILCFAYAAVLLSLGCIMLLLTRENRGLCALPVFYTSAATRVTNSYERVINFEITVATVTGIEHISIPIPDTLITF